MRNVLITGGTGNIGSRLVTDLLQDGNYVQFTSRTMDSAQKAMEKNQWNPGQCKPVIVEFSNERALQDMLAQLDKYPDSIIHNARSLDTFKMDENGVIDSDSFQMEFFNGVIFPYQLTMQLALNGKDLKDVIFISSMYGNVAPTPALYTDFLKQSPVNYGVVKAAQIHLVKELAVRLAPKIRVNAISYGGVEGRVDEEFKERYGKLVPTGRMLNHGDLYPPVRYILENSRLNITGENLKVDGGWTIW
ncbi:MAG: SDR family oxidoreductase [Bacteroidetes bacterium]|nr:MAG: SDR family oxidoreductase [Bacteroidota bacterium]